MSDEGSVVAHGPVPPESGRRHPVDVNERVMRTHCQEVAIWRELEVFNPPLPLFQDSQLGELRLVVLLVGFEFDDPH